MYIANHNETCLGRSLIEFGRVEDGGNGGWRGARDANPTCEHEGRLLENQDETPWALVTMQLTIDSVPRIS